MSETNDGYDSTQEGRGRGNRVTPGGVNTNVPPTINNNNKSQFQPSQAYSVAYLQQQPFIYTSAMPAYQPFASQQQQPQVNQTNSLEANLANKFVIDLEARAKENKTAAQTNTQQTNTAVNNVQQEIIEESIQKLTDTRKIQKKAEEDKQKEFERLKQENEELKNEQNEERNNQRIDEEIEERYGSQIEDKNREIAELQEAKEMLETEIGELGGLSMKDLLLEDEKSRLEHLEQLEKIVKENNNELSNQTNKLTELEGQLNNKQDSISIIRKILIFFGASEPKEINELKEKISKAKEQMEDSKQDVLEGNKTLHEYKKDYLNFVKEKMATLNESNKKRMNEIKQREKTITEIKNTNDFQQKEKKILSEQENVKMEKRQDYINTLRLNDKYRRTIEEQNRNLGLWSIKEKVLKAQNKVSKYSKETINKVKGNSLGRS